MKQLPCTYMYCDFFPLLTQQPDLSYLDSASTTQKPQVVLDAMDAYHRTYMANVSRGIYPIAEQATAAYEAARTKIAEFIGANSEEVIFVRGTTEAINLVASTYGRDHVRVGDNLVATIMEHHANFVPWQQLALDKKAELRVIDIRDDGSLDLGEQGTWVKLTSLIDARTRIVALTMASNALGTINPVREIISHIKKINPETIILVDAAQAVAHMHLDVTELGADFVAFSGHKMYGPTGIGVLWGRRELLDAMRPYQYGGDMIREVHVDRSIWSDAPHKFEAGTPHIAGAIGLGAAVDFIQGIDRAQIIQHERQLTQYALDRLHSEFGEMITIYGLPVAEGRIGVISFGFGDVHSHDIAQILGERGVCIRAGHHCTMPLHTRLGIGASARLSIGMYTTERDIDRLIEGLEEVRRVFDR